MEGEPLSVMRRDAADASCIFIAREEAHEEEEKGGREDENVVCEEGRACGFWGRKIVI